MPIRKSAVPHEQAFQVHRIERAARLEFVDPAPATPTETDVGPGGRDKTADVAEAKPAQDRRGARKSAGPDEQPARTTPTPAGRAVERPMATPASWGPEPAEPALEPATGRGSAPTEDADAAGPDDSVILKMTIRHPAPGASPTFDDLAEAHGPRAAFRLVMRQALLDYSEAVEAGAFVSAPPDYPESETTIDTNRVFPKAAYAKAARHLNRSGLLSSRMIATAIGRHALAAFIRADRRT
jgi:hypothetical protein